MQSALIKMSDDSGSVHHAYDHEDLVKFHPGKPPGDGYEPGDRPFAKDSYEPSSDTRTRASRSGRGNDDDDDYEPSRYGGRNYTARDGYARGATSDAYERRQYPPPAITNGGYDRRRSYDDNDVDDYYQRSRVQKYRKNSDRGLGRARSHSHKRDERLGSRKRRGSGSSGDESGDENTATKKWAATLAGAAVGSFTAHKAKGNMGKKAENWVPAAIGAVIGGLVGREVEKQVYERKKHHREEEEKFRE